MLGIMNTLTNYILKKNLIFLYTFSKRDSSNSRYVCAVDEILEMDHLKQKIQIVLDLVWHWLRRKP